MSDKSQIVAAAVVVVAALCFGAWVWASRISDCKSLGHGTLYCVVVWGGK